MGKSPDDVEYGNRVRASRVLQEACCVGAVEESEGGQLSAGLGELGDAQGLWDELRAQTCWGNNSGCMLSPGIEREAKV